MSTTALQRLVVRLQFDPGLIRRLRKHPKKVLDTADLTHTECEWLLASDLRAYGSDPLFAPRLLHGVVGEFPVAGALAVAQARTGSKALLAFFGSDRAHRAVQGGHSLALAFGDWLISRVTVGTWADGRIAEIGKLERVLATLRRPGESDGALCKEVGIASVRASTSQVYGALYAHLQTQGDVASAALVGALGPLRHARLDAGRESILCRTTERGPKGAITLEVLPPALAALVEASAKNASRADILALARTHGAEMGEDEEIVSDLEVDRILQFQSPAER